MRIKNFFVVALLFATMFSFVSTCSAAQVSLSNITKEKFMLDLTSYLNSEEVKKDAALVITNLTRDETKDKAQYKVAAWSAFFGPAGSENPCGEVLLYVDESNYVNTIQVSWLKSNNQQEYLAMMSSIFFTLGLSADNTKHLLTSGEKDEDNLVWSYVKDYVPGKHIIMMTTEDDEIRIALIMANDSTN